MAKKQPSYILDLPVEFGNVSLGDHTARLGARVARELLSLDKADEALCDRVLNGRIVEGGFDDAAGQKNFTADRELAGMFAVKGFRVSTKHISFGLAFSMNDIDTKALSGFPKTKGRIRIELITEPKDKTDDDEAGDDAPTLFDGEGGTATVTRRRKKAAK